MKKFIKDWWPLLLIAGWLLWKRHEKRKRMLFGQNPSNGQIPSTPSQQQVNKDYIRQLEKSGYTRSNKACPICGGVLYERKSVVNPYRPLTAGAKRAADWTKIEMPYSVTEMACTNPNCEKFDPRFALLY